MGATGCETTEVSVPDIEPVTGFGFVNLGDGDSPNISRKPILVSIRRPMLCISLLEVHGRILAFR